MHLAARLGNIDAVIMLYETRNTLTAFKNNRGMTAFDIATSEVSDADLNLTRLYADWYSLIIYSSQSLLTYLLSIFRKGELSLLEEKTRITTARKQIACYLKEMMNNDAIEQQEKALHAEIENVLLTDSLILYHLLTSFFKYR